MTLAVWFDLLNKRLSLDPKDGPRRITAAFDELLANSNRWPAPAALIEILNRRTPVQTIATKRLESPTKRAAEAKAFADIAANLGIQQPEAMQ